MILVDNRNNTDPYLNLALEEYLIRHIDCQQDDYVLFYINEPCIVLGKNQSIYKEVNFEYLRNGRLKLARRITGGGTVYHDAGNLSFSFISKFADDKVNNYRYFNRPIVEGLRKVGLKAEMDARNNILLNVKKISGSAQFTDRKNIISHGTLLFDSNLPELRACLRENEFQIETKAVSSVRSSVMNIKEASGHFKSLEELRQQLIKELDANTTLQLSEAQWNEVNQIADEKMSSFEWIYGRSPITIIKKDDVEIEVEYGIVQSLKGIGERNVKLIGAKYEYSEIQKALNDDLNQAEILQRVF